MTVLVPSTSYSFTRTREQLRNKVLSKLRVLDPGESPSPEDSATVIEAMDLRLKEMHQLGILAWQVSGAATEIALTGGSDEGTIVADDYLFPIAMTLVVGADETPVEIIAARQYRAIPNKDDSGQPEKVFIDGDTCYFWPVPSQDYTARLTYESAAADTATSVAPDIPVSAMRAFTVIVAADLVDDFQVGEDHARRILSEAADAWRVLRQLNRQNVDSTTVEITSY